MLAIDTLLMGLKADYVLYVEASYVIRVFD